MNEMENKKIIGKHKILHFVNTFNYISLKDLEEIMEWLKDNNYLSDKGKVFKQKFWELFIKE